MKNLILNYSNQQLKEFPKINNPNKIYELNISLNSIYSFQGMKNMNFLEIFNFENTLIKSFSDCKYLPNLKKLFSKGSCLSGIKYFDLMSCIVFGDNLLFLDNKLIIKEIKKKAKLWRSVLFKELVNGWIITSLEPLKLENFDCKQQKILFIQPVLKTLTPSKSVKRQEVSALSLTNIKNSINSLTNLLKNLQNDKLILEEDLNEKEIKNIETPKKNYLIAAINDIDYINSVKKIDDLEKDNFSSKFSDSSSFIEENKEIINENLISIPKPIEINNNNIQKTLKVTIIEPILPESFKKFEINTSYSDLPLLDNLLLSTDFDSGIYSNFEEDNSFEDSILYKND